MPPKTEPPKPTAHGFQKRPPTAEELAAQEALRLLQPKVEKPTMQELFEMPPRDLAQLHNRILPDRFPSALTVNDLQDDWQTIAFDYDVPVGYIKEIAMMFLDGRSRKTMKMLIEQRAELALQIVNYNSMGEVRLGLHVNTVIRRVFETIKARPDIYFRTRRQPTHKRKRPHLDY